ncbi:MAG TPA: phosphoribosyltransferase family protein, partial [Candidatus Polarisedimenticolia bacterium]|nr:phosphoribosyltransferase family protein [Candidatus Polarisedimenticolia bacterium]
DQLRKRVAEIGAEVTQAFADREICIVGLMKSGLVFMADLVRVIPLDMTCHFLRASSLREQGAGPARTDIVYSAEIPYEGKHILLINDIIDTGITLNFLLDHIREHEPATLKVCALIDKPGERKIDVHPDWAAFTITEPMERFLVGYGLDFAEYYRGLPYIGTIPRPAPPAEGRKITITPGS